MLSDFRKSIQSILYERISSPLSGAIFFSWFVWNWRIPYTLIYGDSSLDIVSRLVIVRNFYINWTNNLILPILSTAFLIFLYPYASTFTLKTWLRFKSKQRNIKNEIEKNKLLTESESNQIKIDMLEQEDRINRLLKTKDDEIELYKLRIRDLESEIKKKEDVISNIDTTIQEGSSQGIKTLERQYTKEFNSLKNNLDMFNHFGKINRHIQNGDSFYDAIDADIIGYYVSHDIISRDENSKSSSIYNFTNKGNYFVKLWYDQRYNKK